MNSKINFIEATHRYINTETGDDYKSATTLLGLFKNKFDEKRIAGLTAKKRGITVEEVLNEWAEIRNTACTKGTNIHLALENFIKHNEIDKEYETLIEDFKNIINSMSDIKCIHSEILLYLDKYKVAGTSDLIFEHNDGTFSVGDFKTNKKFRYYSEYNEHLKYPVQHLNNCEFINYSLQLSLYAYMYETLYPDKAGKCRGLFLLWYNPDTFTWELIHCPYMKHEILMILKNYEKMQNAEELYK